MGNSPTRSHRSSSRELDRFTQPTGLYPKCPWDTKAARKLILERKISPRFPGQELPDELYNKECPICFMYYPNCLNLTVCCKKAVCSECFLQMRPPKKSTNCPFCNRSTFAVIYDPPSPVEMAQLMADQKTTKHGKKASSKSPRDSVASPDISASMAHMFASVADRHQIRQDLRTQLQLDNRLFASPTHTAEVLSPSFGDHTGVVGNAAQLEELMLMEALRRSMMDMQKGNGQEEIREEEHHGDDSIDEVDVSFVHPASPSSNPFDLSICDENGEGGSTRPTTTDSNWNPFA